MMRRLLLTLLAGAAMAFATSSGHTAEIAASIQFEFAQPPAGVSTDFQAREGMSLRFLAIKAIDGFKQQCPR